MNTRTATDVSAILSRDLQVLEKEILAYDNPAVLWKIVPGISNSAGTLCLHLCGNLRHYIGAVLGGTGVQRNRDAEFSLRDLPVSHLLAEIQKARKDVERVLPDLDAGMLAKPFPERIRDRELETGFFLVHLAAHFNYHLGQINYHRRMLSKI